MLNFLLAPKRSEPLICSKKGVLMIATEEIRIFFCVGLGEMTLYGDERHGGTNSLNKNAFLVFWFQPI